MAHRLELDRQGRASFCYNHRNGNPWHRLGTAFDRPMTLAEALHACRADRFARAGTLMLLTEEGTLDVPDRKGIWWPDAEGRPMYLGTVGIDYPIVQYSAVGEIAMAVVDAEASDGVLDTMGLIDDGRKFFGFIDFGDLLLTLPSGATDRMFKGLGFMADHTGQGSVVFWKTNVRAVCNNTVEAGISRALPGSVVRIRHAGDTKERLAQVPQLLGLAHGGDVAFESLVGELDMVAGGESKLRRVVEALWPEPKDEDATDRAKSVWRNRLGKLEKLYAAPSNAGGFGDTGWAVWNTVAEFLDHVQGSELVQAKNAIDLTSSSTAKKRLAAQVLLAN